MAAEGLWALARLVAAATRALMAAILSLVRLLVDGVEGVVCCEAAVGAGFGFEPAILAFNSAARALAAANI